MTENKIEVEVHYEVLRSGAVLKEIYAANVPTINMDSETELKTAISGEFYDYTSVDFLSDKLRVIVDLNGILYTCGIFCITTESRYKSDGVVFVNIEGYSLLYTVQQSKIETRIHLASGALYTTSLTGLLIDAGITDYSVTASTLTLAADRDDWEIGESRLKVINDLLSEISYNSAYMDNSGKVVLTETQEPITANLSETYIADKYSIISPEYSVVNDYHGKANVFKIICSNPDLDLPLTATSENNISTSPFCIANIGRILKLTRVNNIASQAALQLKADELRMKSLISSEEVVFTTAISPTHSVFDIVALDNDALLGVYAETSWSMSLSASSLMTHKAKKALYE